ncbi:DNA-3-methyladenine glycosylase 2 family protein [Propionibacteriaceae bacterium Y1923]|uniref:DNA-3-methyladenine glycosylase 2 family protein n=1 Tax=Aestuariimicrobium sp. Y1814 TaxID=3418742 RepID=UPI003C1876D6
MTLQMPDPEACYRALSSRDPRFDGWVYAGISSTGIYCRLSCPARTPRRENCHWYPTAAAAQAAGFRACRRCQPDAIPGSPMWDLNEDITARAMRMINDGVVDREGIGGLAARLGYSTRQVQRVLQDHAGAGPLALARTRRAHTARLLLQTTRLPVSSIAFQAGFSSVRQFNDTIREVYGQTPTALRGRRGTVAVAEAGGLVLRLPVRQPFDLAGQLAFMATRTVPGLESGGPGGFARTVRLPYGHGIVAVEPRGGGLRARVALADWRDLSTLVARVRAWFDLDADPLAVDEALGAALGAEAPAVAEAIAAPGVRLPGTPDPDELAVRCLVGQQVSLAGAVTVTGRLVADHGDPLEPDLAATATAWGYRLNRVFPGMDTLAGLDTDTLPMPRARGRALVGLADALATGRVSLAAGVDRQEARAALESLPGIGAWTSGYIALRALGDPDILLDTDLVIRRTLDRLGLTRTEDCAPWRSYLTVHLWRLAATPTSTETR